MIANNENAWNDDVNQNQGYGSNSYIDDNRLDDTEGGGNISGSYSANQFMNGPDDIDDDDDTSLATGEDIPDDDELLDDDLEDDDLEDDGLGDDDLDDADLEEDTDVDGTVNGSYIGNLSDADDSNKIPEESESDNEGTGYSEQTEQSQPREGADTSFSEQIDVTPPERHEFPSEGVATKTDFASRDQGRTTGRMLGHEPGTEGI